MMYLKTRYITLKDLQKLGIADINGLIDYQEFNKLKQENKDRGINLKMGTNNIFERGVNLIDNSPIYYNGKCYENKIDIIE
ncbi:Uncharacterised protein [Staphylococcus aureus]|nr:Uncharacterised protein [Staphylococcus aureus]CAC8513131.1 Uncharacterised protein [Staphylococcus aureus]CAC8524001.1 Uncharacterised protein [Staphylococcus aureus]CAC9162296.1 Uncharacterised protein [Staphylococcus aureus]